MGSEMETGTPAGPLTTLEVPQGSKNPGGRPPKRPGDKFSARVYITLRRADKEALVRKAEETGESLAAYMVRRSLGRPAPRVKVEP